MSSLGYCSSIYITSTSPSFLLDKNGATEPDANITGKLGDVLVLYLVYKTKAKTPYFLLSISN